MEDESRIPGICSEVYRPGCDPDTYSASFDVACRDGCIYVDRTLEGIRLGLAPKKLDLRVFPDIHSRFLFVCFFVLCPLHICVHLLVTTRTLMADVVRSRAEVGYSRLCVMLHDELSCPKLFSIRTKKAD